MTKTTLQEVITAAARRFDTRPLYRASIEAREELREHQMIQLKAWTMEEALELIREIRPKLEAIGWHVALAGGVLNKGWSDKDLDLILFPHNSNEYDVSLIDDVLDGLEWVRVRTAGEMQAYWRSNGGTDTKFVEVYLVDGNKRVDIVVPSIQEVM